ncbi:hypothetical protein BH23GEM4_BH23GEM4_14220 [soil metagenome]
MTRTILASVLCAACAAAGSFPVPPASPAISPGTETSESPAATAPANWVDSTLASLTLREKVAQLLMPWTGGEYVALDSPEFDRLRRWVEEDGVGGVIVSIGLPHSYAAKTNALQRLAKVPLLIASDMESGPGMRLAGVYSLPHLLPQGGGTVFPPAMALGAAGSDSLAYAAGRVTGEEARAVGVQLIFGPVLDVNSDPANPIINTRSFGEDPARVARLGTRFMRGARDAGLLTAVKHFPGHGDTDVDSHLALPAIRGDRARLDAVELVPFRTALEAGTAAVLVGHLAVTGVEGANAPPASLSPALIGGVLRGEMGFDGLVFTDAMTMGAVVERFGPDESLVRALEAGADVLLMPMDVERAIGTLLTAVRSGRLTEARIDASVRRVLSLKARAGLSADREVSLDSVDRTVGSRAHTEVAREVAERSLTLVRDASGLAPLRPSQRRVLVVGYADAADLLAGRAFARELVRGGVAVQSVRTDPRTTPAEWRALRASAEAADLVVATASVIPREGRGSISADAAFTGWVEGLAASGKPTIAVSFGSPYLLAAFPSVPAYLLAWGGGEPSQTAAARALLGEISITGTLPISLPPFAPLGGGIRRAAAVLPRGPR